MAAPVVTAIRGCGANYQMPEKLGDQDDPYRHLLSDGSRGGAVPARPERWFDLNDGLANRGARIHLSARTP